MKPLTLSFPHPFLADSVNATLYRKDRCVNLVMAKAVAEPWPIEFRANEKSKLIVQSLKLWEENEKTNSLAIHLGNQLSMMDTTNKKKNPSDSNIFALNLVREMIKSIFIGSFVNGQHYFGIQRKGSPTGNPDWYIRVHPPMRTTSAGSPFLLLSSVDYRLAEDLVATGKLERRKAADDFFRIFEGYSKTMTIWVNSDVASQLLSVWRYVLRINSTKMVPSPWQKKNLPFGVNSPWLATFLSPLYADFPFDSLIFNLDEIAGKMMSEKESCTSCKKTPQNPKRCSRCRAVVYCSVECQRSHWSQHKITCAKKVNAKIFFDFVYHLLTLCSFFSIMNQDFVSKFVC